jgi:hypothetical protein
LTRKAKPLADAIGIAPDSLFSEAEMAGQCDSGFCFI